MRFTKFIVLAIAAFSMTGCGAQIASMYGIPIVDPLYIPEVRKEIKIENDPVVGTTNIVGPTIFYENNLTGNTYAVRSWIAPNNPALDETFQIYVMANYPDWAFLNQAYAEGKMFDTTVIDRSVGTCSSYGCSVNETIGINLTKAQMERFSRSGVTVRILGKRNSETISIPMTYLTAVLQAYEEENT